MLQNNVIYYKKMNYLNVFLLKNTKKWCTLILLMYYLIGLRYWGINKKHEGGRSNEEKIHASSYGMAFSCCHVITFRR